MSPTVRSDKPGPDPARRRNRTVAAVCAGVFLGMIGAAYASIPLYKAFCQVTGYDGTVRKAATAPGKVLDRTISVRFDVNTNGLPWTFTAEQTAQDVKIGETKLALFKVTNNADHAVTARAVYNVVPEQAGAYFQKLQCFCFSDQTLQAHETVEMPVLYFVDPKYTADFETRNKTEVTLSYTFYKAVDGPGAKPAKVAGAGATPARS
jgi:cytochrome c oxidase assembly protein subunit 11